MIVIFSDFVDLTSSPPSSLGDTLEVFMENFSIFGDDFDNFLAHLTKICVTKWLVLSWEKLHFTVRERVVIGHLVSGEGLEVDKAKIEVIQNLPLSATLQDLHSFLEHFGFYWRFIKDFAKVSKLLTTLLWMDEDIIINKKQSENSRWWYKHRLRHRFYKILIGTYLLRSCAMLQTMQWEKFWGSE